MTEFKLAKLTILLLHVFAIVGFVLVLHLGTIK